MLDFDELTKIESSESGEANNDSIDTSFLRIVVEPVEPRAGESRSTF